MPLDPPNAKPPSAKPLSWGSVGAMAGALLWVVGLGCQAAITNHPEYVAALGSTADLSHYSAVLTFIVSALMQHASVKASEQKASDCHAALQTAKTQPPVGPDGQPSALLGVCAALQSAVDESKFDLAKDLLALREKHGA